MRSSVKNYEFIEKLGYDTKQLINSCPHDIVFHCIPGSNLTNGVVLNLDDLRKKHGLPLRYLLKWCFQLLSLESDDLSDSNIRKFNFGLRHVYQEKSEKLKQKKKSGDIELFYNTAYQSYPNDIVSGNENKNVKGKHVQVVEKKLIKSLENAFNKVTLKTKETEEKNKELRTQNVKKEIEIKSLKVKLRTLSVKLKPVEIRGLQSNITLLEKRLRVEKQRIQVLRNINRKERKRLNEKAKYWEEVANKARLQRSIEVEANNNHIKELNDKIEALQNDAENNRVLLHNEHDYIANLEDLQVGVIDLTQESQNGRYTFDTRTDLCIMDLLDCGIAYEKVGHAMQCVMRMCGLQSKNNIYPKKDYVSNCNKRKLSLGHFHAAKVCSETEFQTLYTDETRKQGETFASFITTDANKKPCMLGLKQMVNKAAQTQLDTFKVILDDIDTRMSSLQDQTSTAFKILKNIQYTMSDRAATEYVFNDLLQTYREKLLKEHIENYNDLPDVEKDLLTRMYNFFCGLHLVVNIADVVNKVFLQEQVEPNFDNGAFEQSGDSNIIRALRCICKAFSAGGDEKCGTSLEFKTYLRHKGVKVPDLKPFHGNRFNIIFHNGGVAFYLCKHIKSFLEDVKSEGKISKLNGLLKFVLQSVKNPEIVAGFRILGIFNKFISSPLLKILEDKSTHILDMNTHYQTLVSFLETASVDVARTQELISGEFRPFPDIDVKKDDVWTSLVDERVDPKTVTVLSKICAAACKAFKGKVKDHLIDGNHRQIDESENDHLTSVMPHNKLPERAFGQLDWLLRHRPNSTKLANEAHIVYTMNKTGEWLHQQDEEQISKLVVWSKEQLKSLVQTEKTRLLELEAQLTQISIDKENRAKQLKAKTVERKEILTKEITKLGFWDTRRLVECKMRNLKTKKNKRNALKVQINFRQFVLEQKADKRLFQTCKYQGHTVSIEQLKSNLLELINMAKNTGTCNYKLIFF